MKHISTLDPLRSVRLGAGAYRMQQRGNPRRAACRGSFRHPG